MSRRIRQNKTTQQIKEEQINFLLEDVEKNLGQREELASWIFTSTLENIPKLVAAKTYYPKIFKNCFQPQARHF